MSVIKSGKPTINAAGSAPLGAAIAETTPNDISVTNVVGNVLSQFDDGALIIIDASTGIIRAASDVIVRGGMIGSFTDPETLYLVPDADQTGRSLHFSAAAGNTLAGISLADLTTAVKPKFTVESLVSRLLAKIQEREAAAPALANKFFVVVDQVNKKVGIVMAGDEGATRSDLADYPLNAGEAVKITLTPAAEDVVSDPLPFEGGAV